MKKTVVGLIVIGWSLLLANAAFSEVMGGPWPGQWQGNFYFNTGFVSYEEDTSSVVSDWDNVLVEGIAEYGEYDRKGIEGGLSLGFITTLADEKESWYVDDVKFQTNDMDLWGWEIDAKFGWAISPNDSFTFTPMVGYGYRGIKFRRANFNILDIITIRDTIDEDYDIHHIDLGAKLNFDATDNVSIFADVFYGFVVYNQAKNSLSGDVRGDGGYLIRAELGLDYAISENTTLSFAGFTDLQHLEGGETASVIWPDNDLKTYGGTVAVKFLF